MQTTLYLLMIVAAGGMLWSHQQFNTHGRVWGRPVAGLCGLAAVLLAVSAMVYQIARPGIDSRNAIERELQYQQASMQVLGKTVAEAPVDPNVLVLYMGSNATQDRLLATFREALGAEAKVTLVQLDEGVDPNAEEFTMVEDLLTAKRFDTLVAEHPDCTVLVSLVGLPWDYDQMQYWKLKPNKRPLLVLNNADLANPGLQHFLTKDPAILAVLAYRPDVVYNPDKAVPDDVQAAFDERFLLVTPETIADLRSRFPELFGEYE